MTIRRTEGIGDGTVPDLPGFHQILLRANSPREIRAARVHVADRIAGEHPLATGQDLARDPAVTAGLRELLAMLGLLPDGQVAA